MNPKMDPQATILVVDDEPRLLQWSQSILSGKGYQVLTASDGLAALAVLQKNAVELAIVDLVMPGMEGLETIQQIRRNHPDVKILAVSAAFQKATYLKVAKLVGAHSTMPKPLNPEVLVDTVRDLLSLHASLEAEVSPKPAI